MTDFSNEAYIIQVSIAEAAGLIQSAVTAPHVLMRPRIMPDGDMWCALLGDNLHEGVSGFGKTPQEACAAFDEAWRTSRTPKALSASSTDAAVIASDIMGLVLQYRDDLIRTPTGDNLERRFKAIDAALAKAEGK